MGTARHRTAGTGHRSARPDRVALSRCEDCAADGPWTYARRTQVGPPSQERLASWRWAYSDLRSNAVRGVLAEYLVGQSLGVDMSQRRQEWAAWDLQTPDGVKVEVKCGAYIQAWAAPEKPSQVRYSGLLGRVSLL